MVFIEKPMMDQLNMLAVIKAFHTAIYAVLVAWCGFVFCPRDTQSPGNAGGPDQ